MSELEDPLYKDWVRSALSLKYLKEGLYGFVDHFAKQHHNSILQSFTKVTGSPAASCTECTSENLLPDHPRHGCIQKFKTKCFCYNPVGRRKCPNNVCSRMYDLIVIAHAEGNPLWINTDPRKWYMNHWEIAKCYLSTTGYSEPGTAADTDVAGLLSIIVNNIEIHNYVDSIDNIRKVRDIRNDIMHSKNFRMDQSSLYYYIDQMILVLQDSKILVTDVAAQNAVIKLDKLKRDQIYISLEDTYEMRRQALRAVEDGLKEMEKTKEEFFKQIEEKEEAIYKKLDSHIVDIIKGLEKEKNEFESKCKTAVNEIETKGTQITFSIDEYFESRVNDHENKIEKQSKEIADLKTVNFELTDDEKVTPGLHIDWTKVFLQLSRSFPPTCWKWFALDLLSNCQGMAISVFDAIDEIELEAQNQHTVGWVLHAYLKAFRIWLDNLGRARATFEHIKDAATNVFAAEEVIKLVDCIERNPPMKEATPMCYPLVPYKFDRTFGSQYAHSQQFMALHDEAQGNSYYAGGIYFSSSQTRSNQLAHCPYCSM